MNNQPIGVFDSGVGGISVLGKLVRVLPGEHFIYYGDTANAPYGTKSAEEILYHASDAMDFLLSQKVKAVVIACNTATSAAATALRAANTVPIIGIEPALKPAALVRQGGSILVLATPMTLKLEKFQKLMEIWGDGAVKVPCPGLMELVEQMDFVQAKEYLKTIFSAYDLNTVDAVVLGCTHYVFLRPILEELLPNHIHILDGNTGTANQLKRVLESGNLLTSSQSGQIDFCSSNSDPVVLETMNQLYHLSLTLD